MSSLVTIVFRSTFGTDGSIRDQELFNTTCGPENIFEVVKIARAIFNMDTEPCGVHYRYLKLYRFLGVITMPRDEYVRDGLPTKFVEEDMVAWYTLRPKGDEYEAVMCEPEFQKPTVSCAAPKKPSTTSKPKKAASPSTVNSKKTKFSALIR